MARPFLSLALFTLFIVGCGEASVPKTAVRGTVTMDKKPLKTGEIIFVTPGKSPEVLPINDGKFEGEVEVGLRTIQIAAYKDVMVAAMPGDKPEPSKENYIPSRYNSLSNVKETVEAGKPNEFKYELTSNP